MSIYPWGYHGNDQRICPDCEGRSPETATVCPHCGRKFKMQHPGLVGKGYMPLILFAAPLIWERWGDGFRCRRRRCTFC